MTRAGSHFVQRIWHLLLTKKVQKVEEGKHFRTIYTLRSLPDQGEDVCKFWFRLVQKCKFIYGTNKQTKNKQTFSFIYEINYFVQECMKEPPKVEALQLLPS
jgi:hypothetical protein